MYIAMNRFKVAPGSEAAFEHLWTSRDSHLSGVPGFVEFHRSFRVECRIHRALYRTTYGLTRTATGNK